MNRMRLALLSALTALTLGTPHVFAQSTRNDPVPASAPDHARPKALPSTSLVISAAGKDASFTAAELDAMPRKTVKVHNAHRDAEETYSGVLLTDLLAKAAGDAAVGKPLLHSYVKAEGTDRYWVLYSGIEIEAASHLGEVLVATTLDGKPLAGNGAFMLVATEDRKPQRWVRNLASITLVQLP